MKFLKRVNLVFLIPSVKKNQNIFPRILTCLLQISKISNHDLITNAEVTCNNGQPRKSVREL